MLDMKMVEGNQNAVKQANAIIRNLIPKKTITDMKQYSKCIEKTEDITDIEVAKFVIKRLFGIITEKDMVGILPEQQICEFIRHGRKFADTVNKNIGVNGNADAIITEYQRIYDIFKTNAELTDNDMMPLSEAIAIMENPKEDGMLNWEACRSICYAAGNEEEFEKNTCRLNNTCTLICKDVVMRSCVALNINYTPTVSVEK